MTAEIYKLSFKPLTLYGIQDGKMILITEFNLVDESKRQETVEEIMTDLADNEILIIGGTLIRTERYDCFKVV